MSLYRSAYQHWQGRYLGIWYRRGAIAMNGIRSAWDNKWTRNMVLGAWMLSIVQAAILFGIGQLLVEDSVIYTLVEQFQPQLQTLAKGLMSWIVAHPEISVSSTYSFLFYFFSGWLKFFPLIIITLIIPALISRDLSSKAIIVYSSKAVSRFDYFLGKFMTVFAMLSFAWLLPVCSAWLLGGLLAPDWSFLWHSRMALVKSMTFIGFSSAFLSLIAMGVSAISIKEKSATVIWVVMWVLGNVASNIGRHTEPWLRHLSFNYNLEQLSLKLFHPKTELEQLQDNIPVIGNLLRGIPTHNMPMFQEPQFNGAMLTCGIMAFLAILILHLRVKPE
ncbi:MAG: hypothetical protein O2964_05960 [Verrucomicrobia bacterium]|nr:hypothetical protein [Verrucomicrobiota bacterium]